MSIGFLVAELVIMTVKMEYRLPRSITSVKLTNLTFLFDFFILLFSGPLYLFVLE